MFWEVLNSVLLLLAGVGIFLVGIVKFSQFLQTNSNDKIRVLFQRMGNNRIAGFGIGMGATTVIQSSTATTVIVVGLVNAGVMSFSQSTAVIFGANVGTAISNMLLSLSAFRVKYFFMLLCFVGAIIKMFTSKERLNKLADIFIAFGIIFIGLEVMSMAFRGDDNAFTNAVENMLGAVSFPLLLILIGFALTAVINSSTAATAIFIALAANGLLGFVDIMYLVIGSRLGTTITTLIAAIPASKSAKRAAIMHLLFNLLGTVIFLPIIWPFQFVLAEFFENLIPDPIWQVSIFSLILNAATALILLGFIRPLNSFVYWLVPEEAGRKKKKPQPEEVLELGGFTDSF